MQAIYQEDFEILMDGIWRICLPEYGCKVKVKVDSTYPDINHLLSKKSPGSLIR